MLIISAYTISKYQYQNKNQASLEEIFVSEVYRYKKVKDGIIIIRRFGFLGLLFLLTYKSKTVKKKTAFSSEFVSRSIRSLEIVHHCYIIFLQPGVSKLLTARNYTVITVLANLKTL